MLKRWLDIVGSLVGIIVLAPLMLVIAVAIRWDSKGPAIFRQQRAGYKGRLFTLLKFRTMRAEVDPYGNSPHSDEDDRLTRVGRWIREKSLDELPQLFNVLKGDMSLVGPRPLYERQAERWDARQRRRLDVLPGLTGYAQVYGRGGLTHEDKIELDLEYVEKQSFALDIRLIWATAVGVFSHREAIYEQQYSREKEYED